MPNKWATEENVHIYPKRSFQDLYQRLKKELGRVCGCKVKWYSGSACPTEKTSNF